MVTAWETWDNETIIETDHDRFNSLLLPHKKERHPARLHSLKKFLGRFTNWKLRNHPFFCLVTLHTFPVFIGQECVTSKSGYLVRINILSFLIRVTQGIGGATLKALQTENSMEKQSPSKTTSVLQVFPWWMVLEYWKVIFQMWTPL